LSSIDRARIQEAAAELGLQVGVAESTPGPEAQRLQAFVAAGRHGEMEWMAREPERRSDPNVVLPGVRSVVSVAEPYSHGPRPAPPDDRPRGRIARYALGRDYHRTLVDKVRRLARVLGTTEAARPYVDTGPVMEKPWAQRAGLGWIGKHTNTVSRTLGSWFLLGEVLSTEVIEPDAPHADRCGTCTRCLEVCPTGALRPDEPYAMDARLCISYLTIELRGPIPVPLRPLIGTWIFGCDLCLDVCPWNKFAQAGADARYAPRPEWEDPDLTAMLAWDEATWDLATRGSPIRRAKRAGLLRNAAVALGNAGDRSAVPALAHCLATEPEPLVRGHAAWALGALGGAAAARALNAAREEDAYVAGEIAAAQAQEAR